MGSYISCFSFSSLQNMDMEPPPVMAAQVHLTDGTVLFFTEPIKVIHLLLSHPHHFLCQYPSPWDNAPMPLLPDHQLQLGQLYHLIPCDHLTNSSSTSHQPYPQPKSHSNLHLTISPPHHEDNNKEVENTTTEDGNINNNSNTTTTNNGDSGNANDNTDNHDNGDNNTSTTTANNTTTEDGDCSPVGTDGLCSEHPHRITSFLSMHRSFSRLKYKPMPHSRSSPLCNTPELHGAYQRHVLRRAMSWKPRLQAINEALMQPNDATHPTNVHIPAL